MVKALTREVVDLRQVNFPGLTPFISSTEKGTIMVSASFRIK